MYTRVSQSLGMGGGLGGLVRALGVVSVVATSHTGPSVKPSRGRVVALSVGCGSS